MTRRTLNLATCLPKGVTHSFCTPCKAHTFTKDAIDKVFKEQLPHYIKELQAEFQKIPMGHLNGLAPTNQGGPFDRCVIDGSWSPEHQAAHGGPIPLCNWSSRQPRYHRDLAVQFEMEKYWA